MAPFSIPAPSIIPLRLPVFGGPKSIDTDTKIQLLCETYLDHKIYYTLDGTKPQPYDKIVQGSKTIKYCSPFCLPAGKVTIKAMAVNANVYTMCSSIVTKRFEVLKTESENGNNPSAKTKKSKCSKLKKKYQSIENKNSSDKLSTGDGEICGVTNHRYDPESAKEDDILQCFDEAFIGGSEFDTENSDLEDSIEDQCSFPVHIDASDNNGNDIYDTGLVEESGDIGLCDVTCESIEKDSLPESIEELVLHEENLSLQGGRNVTLTNDTAMSVDTQFCCLKCDLTLQPCMSCNKMNGVSSKFCIGCGKQLSRICSFCKEYNPSVATFCQYCGKKLNSKDTKQETLLKVDHSVMAKPVSKNAGIQKLPVMVDKYSQTINCKSPVKKNSPDMKRIPHHSPGRGYWHQQVDYICNHLKSHAYNNIEFRKEISEPMLCDFKSAHIAKHENNVTVTVVFSALVTDKNSLGASEETKPADKSDPVLEQLSII